MNSLAPAARRDYMAKPSKPFSAWRRRVRAVMRERFGLVPADYDDRIAARRGYEGGVAADDYVEQIARKYDLVERTRADWTA